jgi:hypothetical protein
MTRDLKTYSCCRPNPTADAGEHGGLFATPSLDSSALAVGQADMGHPE